MAKKKKDKQEDLEESDEEEATPTEGKTRRPPKGDKDEEVSERVTSKDAGKGLIILGTILILVAWFMPFVLGTSDQKMWSLGSEVFMFGVVGIVAIAIGLILLNFERLSRKL